MQLSPLDDADVTDDPLVDAEDEAEPDGREDWLDAEEIEPLAAELPDPDTADPLAADPLTEPGEVEAELALADEAKKLLRLLKETDKDRLRLESEADKDSDEAEDEDEARDAYDDARLDSDFEIEDALPPQQQVPSA